jgi:8-oxo-dGTP pyrophosphatase MutT (NUDIX family)
VVPVVRPTVRVLLLDERDRLLLFSLERPDGVRVWFAAGGGIEPGEDAERAAVREVAEETGLRRLDLGPRVWRRRHVLPDSGGGWVDLREEWFLARTASFTIDTSGFTAHERREISGHRWWSPSELAAADPRRDLLVPRDLARLLARLLAEGPPAEVEEVGI